MNFDQLNLAPAILRAVQEQGYTAPTPIQAQAIPLVLEGHDLLAGAQTGTGKTAGFTLPMLHKLSTTPARQPGAIRALVLTPTRELAAQVEESVRTYGQYLDLKSTVIFGGVGMNPQVDRIRRGVDILVATPGRLLDLEGQDHIDLSNIEILVLDEADRMLDMGFIHDVKKVLARLPAQRQNLLFSATFSKDIIALANKLLHDPERIEVTPPNTTVERIEQRVFRIPATHKRALLAHLITLGAWEQVLVFTRTKHGANRLAEYLDKHGLPAAAIHGNKSQNARTKALADFKANQVRILVATDIAARGLDIDQLPHVVNYELPNVEEDYVHRIGRTGRAGRSGEAISLVAPDEEKLLKAIERMTKQQIPAGDMQGFDPASVEVEKPEARGPRPERQPRADKPRHEPKHEPKADAEAGDGQGKKRKRRRGKGKGEAGQQPQQNLPRQAGKPAAPLALPPERDPEEFLDDEFDNFGNRADYVPPQPQPQGRNPRRGGQGAAQAGRGGQGRTQGAPRQGGQGPRQGGQKQGQRQGGQGQGQNRNRGGQGQRQGGGRREEPRYERQEPAVQDSRAAKQPLIIRKGERLPTLEQLESLPGSRPRSEKPALLTRKSDTAE